LLVSYRKTIDHGGASVYAQFGEYSSQVRRDRSFTDPEIQRNPLIGQSFGD
jgi:hypothetical protein